MTTNTANFLATKQPCEKSAKQEPAKHWFTRHFLRPTPRQGLESAERIKMIRQISLRRPRTAPTPNRPSNAPSSGQATKNGEVPQLPVPMLPTQFQHLQVHQELKGPQRPPRPDPDVLLDVDAWLDASKPSSPLMGGLSYWREGNPADTEEAGNVQYAIPIIKEPDCDRPTTSHNQQFRSFYRRAKNQVRMPSICRVKSPRAVEEDDNACSESAPMLTVPYEQTQPHEALVSFTRITMAHLAARPSTAAASVPTGSGSLDNQVFVLNADLALRHDNRSSVQLQEPECEMERLVLGQGPLAGSTLRPGALAASHLPREDSMGSFSSAPTYFSGMPPPSYKSRPASSRPASILTTSSFGCIDGMNPEQRELSQKRAAQKQRSMKRRLRKLAQKASLGK